MTCEELLYEYGAFLTGNRQKVIELACYGGLSQTDIKALRGELGQGTGV